MLHVFIKGCLVGLFIAIPVGPVGVLCMRRTLTKGKLSGLFSGLGAASADALYAGITGFGLSFISDALLDYRRWIEVVGGVILVIIGAKAFRSKPLSDEDAPPKRRLVSDFVTTFMLTFTNPATILSFAAFFAGLGLASSINSAELATAVVAGVFCGSALWWFTLSEIMGFLRQKNPQALLLKINKISGIVLIVFGIVIVFL